MSTAGTSNNGDKMCLKRGRNDACLGKVHELPQIIDYWLECIRRWYPNLHKQIYFVPPLHFNRTPCDVEVFAKQPVMVRRQAKGRCTQLPTGQTSEQHNSSNTCAGYLQSPKNYKQLHTKSYIRLLSTVGKGLSGTTAPEEIPAQQVATTLTSKLQRPSLVGHPSKGKTPSSWRPAQTQQLSGATILSANVQDSHVRDDHAHTRVLRCLRDLTSRSSARDAMMVISHLNFTHYLNRMCCAAASALFPRPSNLPQVYRQGDFDLLIIHSKSGLIVGEVKSVGDNFDDLELTPEKRNSIVAKKVEQALQQQDIQCKVLKHIISDLPDIQIMRTLVLPNVTSFQLMDALNAHPHTGQALMSRLNAANVVEAIQMCLCRQLFPDERMQRDVKTKVMTELEDWWTMLISARSQRGCMTSEIYEYLVARMCGPATTVEIFCVTRPRVEIRTEGEGVSETGERMTLFALYPEQMRLLSSQSARVFLTGPPGTGKSIVLVLKGLQWMSAGHDIHVVSTWYKSPPSSFLIEYQLQKNSAEWRSGAAEGIARVVRHQYDLEKDSVTNLVRSLAALVVGGQLHIIADEAGPEKGNNFTIFCTDLLREAPLLSLWSAAIDPSIRPPGWTEEKLTVPLRSPPSVVREVSKADQIHKGRVYGYSDNGVPAPTDGPAVNRLFHEGRPGHLQNNPRDCEVCGRNIARFLIDLCVGQPEPVSPDQVVVRGPPPLQYRDVLVLCENPWDSRVTIDTHLTSQACGLVRGLRSCHLPVRVVEKDAENEAIRDTALALSNKVTVTHWGNVHGLERKIVVEAIFRSQFNVYSRLYDMSRSSAQLVLIDVPCDDNLHRDNSL